MKFGPRSEKKKKLAFASLINVFNIKNGVIIIILAHASAGVLKSVTEEGFFLVGGKIQNSVFVHGVISFTIGGYP
jgi:hypothetical protein